MGFITRNATPNEQTPLIKGANAPREKIDRSALFIPRAALGVMPNNAPAQNYRAGIPSNHQMTAIQAAFISARQRYKLNGKTSPGASSWVGENTSI